MAEPDVDTAESAIKSQQAIYLYCFTRPGKLGSCDDLGVPGVDGLCKLEMISVKDVAALHSQVALEEFHGPMAEDSLKDPNWIIPRACRHERVIAAMMNRSPVLPVRFGSIFSSTQALKDMMNERQQEISKFLESIGEKEEWSMKGVLNANLAGEWLSTTDADLAGQRQLLPESPGARYLQNKRYQAELQKQVKRWCGTVLDQVHDQLQLLGSDVIQLPLREVDGTNVEMVYHATLLLNRECVEKFMELAKRFNTEYRTKGFMLESSGPWPPYHFCPSLAEPR